MNGSIDQKRYKIKEKRRNIPENAGTMSAASTVGVHEFAPRTASQVTSNRTSGTTSLSNIAPRNQSPASRLELQMKKQLDAIVQLNPDGIEDAKWLGDLKMVYNGTNVRGD